MPRKQPAEGGTVFICERPQLASFLTGYSRYLAGQGLAVAAYQPLIGRSFAALPKLAAHPALAGAQRIVLLADATERLNNRLAELDRLELRSGLAGRSGYSRYLWPGKRASSHWQPGYLEDLLLELLRQEAWGGSYAASLRGAAAEYLRSADTYLAAAEQARGRAYAPWNCQGRLLYALLAAQPAYAGASLAAACGLGAFALGDARLAAFKSLLVREA